jgi:phospholipase C
MKASTRILFSLFFLSAALAPAQTIPAGTFKPIIIIVQENRTPDNLFGAGPAGTNCQNENPFEPGVDIEDGGYGYVWISNTLLERELICLGPLPLDGQYDGNKYSDPEHAFPAWVTDYDTGSMDGFCHEYDNSTSTGCWSYSFVQKSDVQPYFDIATAYGFGNYMFQTNESGSFSAHQFLFTGTSAPVAPKNDYYLDFVAGNPDSSDSGCPQGKQTDGTPAWVDPTGSQFSTNWWECYPHDSLVTNANGDKGVTWRYYTPSVGIIWDAPASIPEVCYGEDNLNDVGQPCSGNEWGHIARPNTGNYDGAPILDDIANCSLQKISFVIPDQVWSDHPGGGKDGTTPYGPSWVGDIIDAVGNSWTNSNGKCDYWGNNSNDTTAIFVVWDDWGGWFDHVTPPNVYRSSSKTTCPTSAAPNGWGCGYVYGFRVPFLVASEYTKAGYVSGACTGNCPNKALTYQHDFGSILAFTEYNFGMPFIDQSGDNGYADYNAIDRANGNIPLSDFFSLSNQRNFTNITTPYSPSFFENYYVSFAPYAPPGPDGTDSD